MKVDDVAAGGEQKRGAVIDDTRMHSFGQARLPFAAPLDLAITCIIHPAHRTKYDYVHACTLELTATLLLPMT
jgi:hypothetical protein